MGGGGAGSARACKLLILDALAPFGNALRSFIRRNVTSCIAACDSQRRCVCQRLRGLGFKAARFAAAFRFPCLRCMIRHGPCSVRGGRRGSSHVFKSPSPPPPPPRSWRSSRLCLQASLSGQGSPAKQMLGLTLCLLDASE